MQFTLIMYFNAFWKALLVKIYITINNFTNVSTRKCLNEIIYNIKLFKKLTLLLINNQLKFIKKQKRICKKALNTLSFVTAKVKILFNKKYMFLNIKPNKIIFVKFHKGY